MARTKKQTLVNACERRRQIQEEIRRETLAARQKREGFSSVGNVHSAHNGVPIANLPTVSHLEKMDNGTEVSSDGDAADCCRALNTGSQGTMSSVTHAASDASLYNEGNLPKAVICIPDICRSPTKLATEEPAVQEESSKGPGLWGKSSPHSHSVKPREESRKYSSSKHFEKSSEDDVIASLRSLRAVSEKVREEKSRKSRQAPYAPFQSSGSGRRSPRQSSLLLSDASTSHKSVSRKYLKDATSFSDEKPKVNIFTDNLGKDLGKRVRSPRRLSEDMIALPIFSARRWSNSPKDSSAASYSGGRSPDEISIYDGMETLSLHTPQKRESFKSVSPVRNKQSGICESSKTSSLTGSSKFTLCEKGSTSTRNFTELHKQHNVQSDDSSPSMGASSSALVHEKCINPVLRQGSLCEDNILQTFQLQYSKPGLLLSDKMKTVAQFGSDRIQSECNSVPHDTSAIDDSVGGSWKTSSASTSFPIKENTSRHKTQEDADNQKSSTCKELMSTGMLIKCENRCLNDTVDSFCDAKTDISDGTDLTDELNKSIKGFKNIINVTMNSSQVMDDTEKETNRSKCPLHTTALSFPLEMGDDKPQSSLLCAMLVGGTEVAHSYNQERVRVKSQGGDKSDSELDSVKCDSSHLVSSCLLPQQTGEPADVRHKINAPCPQTVDSERLDNQDSQGLLVNETAEELLPCDKVTADENTAAVTSTCEPAASMEIQDDSDITDENIAVVETEPVHFYQKLKQVNESVLKLIDIDVEKEFLQELEVDDSGSDGNVEDKQSDALSQSEQCQSSLYGLISSLGTRLQCADSQIPFSTPVDIELIGKLMESCPKNAPDIMPRLKTTTRKKLLYKRMEEENVKETSQIQNLATEKELYVGGHKDDGACVVDHGNASTTTTSTDLHAETDNSQAITGDNNSADMQTTSTETVQNMDLDMGSSNMCLPLTYLEDPSSSRTEADSSNIPESIDQNSSAKESAVTGFVDLNTGIDKNNFHKCSEVLQTTTSKNSVMPADFSTRKVTEMAARLSFQKSKTCDDFNERLSTNSVSHVGTLRRVNSSPQMNTKQVTPPLSSLSLHNYATKDSYTKSKLGSKIPIPGTSYHTKSKRSWRIPRTIVEPKPLSVLSDLEQPSSQPTSAFTCPDLQKYLNVPSNRVIVTSDKQEEMRILDAQAKEQEELDEKMMDDKDKNMDDDISLDYKNFEPDFDEVDGMLFMSFFTEIELRAHVRVEKALEWDKDDTMLRVSRAKAFEEAKSQKEDMGHFKLKHLRGQHMRWKKYRRMYSNEVKALMEAQNTEQSQDRTPVTKKTSDLSKIKGWKRKNASMPEIGSDVNDNFNWSFDTKNISFSGHKNEVPQCFSPAVYDDSMFDDSVYFTSENMMADDSDKPEVSSRSRRRQGFSHQKAHRQLFRELHMDWEDRMIHRKLGGWSLKGNRPQAYSSAAKKRQEQKSKEVESGGFELKDVTMEAGSFEEIELETTEVKDHSEDSKKKRTIKIIYPLLTEKMARNALKTLLETGDIQRGMKRKKNKARQSPKQLPTLTHLICKSEPDDETVSTQLIDPAGLVLSVATTLLTPSAASSFTSLSSPSTSIATVPLEIDLQDEPVMEGVDIGAENISSPSVTDTSSMKSCGKPGCRYGCICHLCSVNESSAPLPSLLSKQPAPACDKEYCRLGCICDSIDHERPIPSKTHCRRPSCMLQCVCLESGSFDGNEDIPYLPSMRRRPKPGDRFSNLPQREKTHRSAKNLDAVTRKAMMLYETSEIYCERVERTRKRSDMASSPASTSFDTSLLGATVPTSCSSAVFDIDSVSDPSEDSSFQADTFSTDVPMTSEAMGSTPSHPFIIFNTSPQHQHLTRNNTGRLSKPAFILDDVRQTVSIMEPSAHKRKRKSHPLSDEIFISSTCARTQPFKLLNACRGMRAAVTSKDSEEVIEVSSSVSVDSTCPVSSTTLLPLPCKLVDVQLTDTDNDSKEMIPKISSVHTLASEGKDVQQWENAESETPLSHSVVTSSDSVSHQRLQNLTALQQTSAQSSISHAGSQRQFHGWHKSMVCLKARSSPSSQDPGEDDVKEEDEVKLLEFTANCNWEGAKRAILAKVAQCLTRGQYPQPRTMNVCDFVVEILPKAHQPSHIPAELRAKLPGQMYSIRVRITRRESLIKKEDDSDVICLSGSPSVKSESGNDSINFSLKESPSTSVDQRPGKSTSDSTFFTSNSVGISGLSQLFISSPPVSGQPQNSSSDYENLHSSQTGGGHNFRRQSLESALVFNSPEYKQATGHHTMTVQSSLGHKPKASSFLRFGNSASQKTVGSALDSESIKTVTGTTVTSSLITANNATSKKLNIKPLNVSQTNQPFASKPGSSGVTPIFGPFNAKDVKYMMSGKEGAMQLIEIAPTGDKNKKLIAVPITLSKASADSKGKQSAVVALPVSGMGQSRIVPVLSPPTASSQLKTAAQQVMLRLPSTQASPGVRHPVVLQPVPNSVKCHPPRFQVVPLQVSNSLTVHQPKIMPAAATTTAASASAVQSCASTSVTQKPVNSSNEMIMVFDAAHIKASQTPVSSVASAASVSTHDKEQKSECVDHSASVVPSDNILEISTNTAANQQKDKDFTQGFVVEKSPLKEDVLLDKRIENVLNDCDNVISSKCEHLIKKPGRVDLGDGIESVSQGDCNGSLYTGDIDMLDGQPNQDEQLPEVSVEAEVSIDNIIDINCDTSVKEENLVGDSLVKTMLSENASARRKNYSSIFSNCPISFKEHIPRTLQEFAMTGSKRLISAVGGLEGPLSPAMKKPCLAVENPAVLDEDSMTSLNSVSGIQQAAASPLSSVDRPKSVMSGALSTGSSEDMLILLSSEEDIDVGEDDKPDDIISYRVRVERALQNDHGSMYTRVDPVAGASQSSLRRAQSSDDIVRRNGVNPEDVSRATSKELQQKFKDLQKVNHHNQLERLRRSRMKTLFDELQQHVLKERRLPRDHVMSKVKVLVEAKKVVLHLSKCVLEGNEQVKRYERKNKSLQNKLAALKGNMMQQNVSFATISRVMQRASEKFLLQSINTNNTDVIQSPEDIHDPSPSSEVMHPVTADGDIEDSQEMVNLVSPSTDGDRLSERPDVTTPVYEDISDPEDALMHTYKFEVTDD